MTPEETRQLLKLVVAGDRRTIGPEDAAYWHAVLAPIDFTKAVDALVMIRRREPDKWVDPGHLWQLCSTKTDGEHTGPADLPDCDHGNFCGRCKLVHWPHEPCEVLEPRALPPVTVVVRALPAGPSVDVESPEVDPARARQMEDERARQLAALAALVEPETAQP